MTKETEDGRLLDEVALVGYYLDEEVLDGDDDSQDATLPDGTQAIWVFAEGGAAYASVNDDADPATSGVYVPEDQVRLVGPYTNIETLGVYAATGVTVHLVYEG